METISLTRVVMDSLLYGAILGAAILASLFWNPRLWIQDFPQEIRDKVPPLNATERKQRAVFGLVFMSLVFGLPLLLVSALRAQYGSLSVPVTFGYMYALLFAYNLIDALVVDLLVITIWQPRRLAVPGAEGLGYLMRDPRRHIEPFLKGMVFILIAAALLTGLAHALQLA